MPVEEAVVLRQLPHRLVGESLARVRQAPLRRLIRVEAADVEAVLRLLDQPADRLLEAGLNELSGIDEIGPVIAQSVFEFLHGDEGTEAIADLRAMGLVMTQPRVLAQDRPLEGKTLVVTGTLPTFSRKEIQDLIHQLGGHASSSISGKTDFLVAGENAGSKLDKAKKLGVTVLDESAFVKLIGR